MIRATGKNHAHADGAAPATPVGGARILRGRGCRLSAAFLSVLPTLSGATEALPVPSGQPVVLSQVLLDENPGELWVRFRFVAPKIGQTVGRIGYDVTTLDMAHLCETLARPYLDQHQLAPARIVISFADRVLDFGVSDPQATQFFEAYRIADSGCIWEGF
ncbi:DUF6497 family protein [Primorskyibacter sp. S87]|uniref:DUF6497 family protein n=1 Tax=Primorskyibacter sp. S87 TaxID=3415126 RepID=UPI003C7C1875